MAVNMLVLHRHLPPGKFLVQQNLHLSFPDTLFSPIHSSVSMAFEQILFKLWFRIYRFPLSIVIFQDPNERMNRGYTVFVCYRH
jgi:hypothetical protein